MEDILTEKLHINEGSERLIRVALKQYNIMAVIYIFASVLGIAIEISRIYKYRNEISDDWVYMFSVQMFPYIGALQILLSIIQFLYYLNGVKCQQNAIKESNQLLFDRSFLLYKRGNVFSIAIVSLSAFYEIAFFYIEFFT